MAIRVENFKKVISFIEQNPELYNQDLYTHGDKSPACISAICVKLSHEEDPYFDLYYAYRNIRQMRDIACEFLGLTVHQGSALFAGRGRCWPTYYRVEFKRAAREDRWRVAVQLLQDIVNAGSYAPFYEEEEVWV